MAFMVPLVKNHYEIYNVKSSLTDHDNGYSMSSSINNVGGRRRADSKTSTISNSSNKSTSSVILNGMVLLNGTGRSKTKPKVILTTGCKGQPQFVKQIKPNGQKPQQIHQQQQRRSSSLMNNNKKPQQLSPQYSSTNSVNTVRSFPHVRRTVRNPITNRVYSYSVSIPEYVAEEDEEELAALERELADEEQDSGDSSLDQMMIFSTSAPAGTGPIDNGILDIVDEEDFILCTGTRLPSTISNQTNKSSKSSLLSMKKKAMNNNNDLDEDGNCIGTPSSSSSSLNDNEQSYIPSSNSREYMELLQKFILHLKMLKLKKIFHSKSNKKASSRTSSISDSETSSTTNRRARSSTLDDSNQL